MKAFEYVNARDLKHASTLLGNDPGRAKVIAGGIDLLGEMKEYIIEPDRLVNLKTVKNLDYIRADRGGLRIGALATLVAIEEHKEIQSAYAALAEAAGSVGTPQIRHVGTLGGNLCQRPRCWYYRDEAIKCIKKGGPMCYASQPDGENKYNAILGGGPSFIVHPSDCAPALVALNASVVISGPKGSKSPMSLQTFFTLPNQNPMKENVLQPNELVAEVRVPRPAAGTRSTYLKFQERDSFDWAVSSVATALRMENGVCSEARVVLGGVAPVPWRSPEAEAVLKGKRIDAALANQAADAALARATPLSRNAYKVPLTKVLIRRAILAAAA
jgi:xanthine dehydrogenase YagS FAD-binding subunit